MKNVKNFKPLNQSGGEGEIRTLEWVLAITRFRVVRLQPLGHLSAEIDTSKNNSQICQNPHPLSRAEMGALTKFTFILAPLSGGA
jgi:hypothetical protein